MAIEVIEGGRADGTDLVVGDHLLNPVAKANGVPQRMVRAIPIGEDYAVLGISLEPMLSAGAEGEQDLCAVLTVVGGRESSLVPTVPVKLILGEVCRISLADLREKLGKAIDGQVKGQPE